MNGAADSAVIESEFLIYFGKPLEKAFPELSSTFSNALSLVITEIILMLLYKWPHNHPASVLVYLP